MTRLELLASLLDQEALPHEKQAPGQVFKSEISFWQLCLDAYSLLMEKKELAYGKDKPGRDSEMASRN
jgi:hypothetical protein